MSKEKEVKKKLKRAREEEAPAVSDVETKRPEEAEEKPRKKPVNDELEPEEDGLSRKEKRKRRKLEAAGLLPIDAPPKVEDDAAAKGPAKGQTPAKEAHGVWIGNMNFKTSSQELIDWLAERGIGEVTRINMPAGKKAGENNRGSVSIRNLGTECGAPDSKGATGSHTSTLRQSQRFKLRLD